MIIYYRIHRKLNSILSTLWNQCCMTLGKIEYGNGFTSCGKILFRNYAGKNGIILGTHVSINSCVEANPVGGVGKTVLFAGQRGHIEIGNGVGISNCVIFSQMCINIGDETCIGAGCKIYDTDFHSVNPDYRLNGNTDIPALPVVIGKRVFIGANVTILKGVTIGDEAVVGAGSIVTKDIPAGEIWAGNPARFIRKCR